jgi:hypothetical protein
LNGDVARFSSQIALDKRESPQYRPNHGTNDTAPCRLIPVRRLDIMKSICRDALRQQKNTKLAMVMSVVVISVVLSGCISTNPNKAGQTISHWVPPGTRQDDAITILKQHGFQTELVGKSSGESTLSCCHTTWLHFWIVEFQIKDGKIVKNGIPQISSNLHYKKM